MVFGRIVPRKLLFLQDIIPNDCLIGALYPAIIWQSELRFDYEEQAIRLHLAMIIALLRRVCCYACKNRQQSREERLMTHTDTSRPSGKWLRYGLIAIALCCLAGLLAGFVGWRSLYSDMPALPETEPLWAKGREQAYEFRTADGDLIAIRGPRYGRVVQVSELPAYVIHAFISAEDKRFYEHDGADTTAIARAAWLNWRSGRTVSGASTITQQLVKNLILDPRQTVRRKLQEVRLARQLEKRLSKDEILTLYLNRIYFGAGAYGIDAAAESYFGKPATELSLAEADLLATLPKAPSRLALNSNLDAARERQLYVLTQMVEEGFITPPEKDAAQAAPITLAEAGTSTAVFGYVLDTVTERLGQMVPDAPGDLVITLTIDPSLQNTTHEALTRRIAEEGDALAAGQASAILIKPDGAIVAMIGGLDYATSKFNRVTQARRQPGSSFKPFVYAAALQAGLDPYSVYQDEPVKFGEWEPKNYSPGYFGPVTMSEAFAKSLNTVAASIGNEIGEPRIIALAKSFGINSDLRPLPSIALGSQEVTLYELARAYGTFAKSGERLDPYLILRIEDSRGQVIFERPEYDSVQIYPSDLAESMNAMLARVVQNGTGANAAIPGWTVAGKTGTSQDWRDGWFIGFTSEMIGGVWVGNDDDTAMNKVTGGGLPAKLWSEVMTAALSETPATPLAGAEGIFIPSPRAEERITFYRSLSGAFGAVEQRTLANTVTGETELQR